MNQTALWTAETTTEETVAEKRERQRLERAMRKREADRVDILSQLRETVRFAQEESPSRSLERTTPIHRVQYSEDQHGRHLKYMAQEGREPAYQVTRHPDGSVSQFRGGRETPNTPIRMYRIIEENLPKRISAEILNDLIHKFGAPLMAESMTDMDTGRKLRTAVLQAVETTISQRAIQYDLPPGATRPNAVHQHPEQDKEKESERSQAQKKADWNVVEQILREFITDRDVAIRARKMSRIHGQQPTPNQYNLTLTGGEPPPRPSPKREWEEEPNQGDVQSAGQRALGRIINWTPLRYTQGPDGQAKMEILCHPRGGAEYTISRERDGRLRIHPETAERRVRRLNFNAEKPQVEPVRQATKEILQEILKRSKDPGMLLSTTLRYGPTESIYEEAARRVSEKMTPPVMPPRARTKSLKLEDLPKLMTRMAREKLAAENIVRGADRMPGVENSHWLVRHYNNLTINHQVMEELSRTSPGVAEFYTRRFMADPGEEYKLDGPGEAVRLVKAELNLTKGQWKWFTRIGESWNSLPSQPEHLIEMCRLLDDANQPKADPAYLTSMSQTWYLNMRVAQWRENGDTEIWKAWTQAVNRYLGLAEPYQEQRLRDLRHLGDAITLCKNQERRWGGPAAWDELMRRATQILAPPKRHAPNQAYWKSALGQMDIGGFTFLPVTTGWQLEELGNKMGNCLSNYDRTCVQGNDRIFAAHRTDGELEAAVQLHDAGGRWNCAQIEGPKRTGASPEMKAACRKLAEQYDRADRANPGSE